jgi:hypothetical protein
MIVMDEDGWERYELHGAKAYQLDICEAINDQYLCPGVTLLKAGERELGPVFCNCLCIETTQSVAMINEAMARALLAERGCSRQAHQSR